MRTHDVSDAEVEAAARAMYERAARTAVAGFIPWSQIGPFVQSIGRDDARAALAAAAAVRPTATDPAVARQVEATGDAERIDWEARAKAFEAALRKLRDQQYQHPWTVNEAAQERARADAAEARAQAAEAEAGRLTSERDAMRSALLGVPKIAEEIRAKWDEGMRAGKLLVALIDPTLRYRDDCTAVHEAAALASQGSEAAEQGEHAR
jgi:hypothetical protein